MHQHPSITKGARCTMHMLVPFHDHDSTCHKLATLAQVYRHLDGQCTWKNHFCLSCWWSLEDPEPGKNIHTWFFEPYEFPKGWGQAFSSYIQHIYNYSTLSNYPKVQDSQENEFANAIDMHQWSLCNWSGNDATLWKRIWFPGGSMNWVILSWQMW